MATPASIVIPTRARLPYLEVALASIAPAAARAGAEVVVVDDAGSSQAALELAGRYGARYEPHPGPLGLNVARNTGVERSHGELVVFVDDDVRAREGWLDALLDAARENPDVDVFAGPIVAAIEGERTRRCAGGHEPITTLDLGPGDTDARFAWGANMAIRRTALERVGAFDVSLEHGGDEQEWQERLRALDPGARVRYVAAAGVEHRRVGEDARLRSLMRTAFLRGAAARRFDARRGEAPTLRAELHTLARCVGHVARRRCASCLTTVAHSAGRVQAALEERLGSPREADCEDFLSGTSGTVGGLGATGRALADGAIDAYQALTFSGPRLAAAARREPPTRRVLVLGVARPEHAARAAAAEVELGRSRHRVEIHTSPQRGLAKFENLNRLLAEHPPHASDWLIVLDDDVELPRGFLDRFLFLCERFSLVLAQPAQRLLSHAAWPVTRRRAGSVVRETGFVEIGPLTAFASRTFPVLLPFPELRMGWGLDLHWAHLAREHGWRCGVIDAVPIRHLASPVASAYAHADAVAEARAFLAGHPYVSAREADRTLLTHRRW